MIVDSIRAMRRLILHIDLDAFFCSVEEIRHPTLRGKPFAVGGSPKSRGVVASCSYPARVYGIRSAMPMAQAVKLCPDLIIIPGDYPAYSYFSQRVMGILRTSSNLLEQISIDEAFLDISDINTPADVFARSLQKRINENLGLPCSIGIATNKLVAKIATEVGKASAPPGSPPNAITIAPPGQESEFLAPLPVQVLWGVGPKTYARLKELNIFTIGELARCSEDVLVRIFGKNGYELSRRAKGIDDQPVIPIHPIKSISKERTFVKDIADQDLLNEALETLAKEVSRRLRKSKFTARTIRLKLRYADFKTITRQMSFDQPTDQLEIIETTSKRLLSECWSGAPVRLLGIGVSSLVPSKQQLSLWEQDDNRETSAKELQLQEILENLQARFGKESIHWGIKEYPPHRT